MENGRQNEDWENDYSTIGGNREGGDDQNVVTSTDAWNNQSYHQQLAGLRLREAELYNSDNFIHQVDVQRTSWDNSPQYQTLGAGLQGFPVHHRVFLRDSYGNFLAYRIVPEEVQYPNFTGLNTEQNLNRAAISPPAIDPSLLQIGNATMNRMDDTSTTFTIAEYRHDSSQILQSDRDDPESQSQNPTNSPSVSTTSTEDLRDR
ncbi:hypothetical protein BZA77DRAFT_157822 [Pyronema omphalodes]|nr:hypothetical protein BZA77DRAFT_157822 [Pyronema omphalodes]